jgi:hypothetical protein
LIYDALHVFAQPFEFFCTFLEFYGFLGQIMEFVLGLKEFSFVEEQLFYIGDHALVQTM